MVIAFARVLKEKFAHAMLWNSQRNRLATDGRRRRVLITGLVQEKTQCRESMQHASKVQVGSKRLTANSPPMVYGVLRV